MIGVGYAPAKGEIDAALGDAVVALEGAFDVTEKYYRVIGKYVNDGYLASVGYTPEQVSFINDCIFALHNLYLTATGQREQVGLSNFLDGPEELAGVK